MKAKLVTCTLVLLSVLFLILSILILCVSFLVKGGQEDIKDYKAKRLGLVCVNGYVFKETPKISLTRVGESTLEPLNIECSNGKVIVD